MILFLGDPSRCYPSFQECAEALPIFFVASLDASDHRVHKRGPWLNRSACVAGVYLPVPVYLLLFQSGISHIAQVGVLNKISPSFGTVVVGMPLLLGLKQFSNICENVVYFFTM